MTRRTEILIGVGALVLCAGGAALNNAQQHAKDDEQPAAPVREMCEFLRDPEYAGLTAADWRRVGQWTQGEMVVYVTRNCPDQLGRVDR